MLESSAPHNDSASHHATANDHARDTYEQLLALSDRIGAAYATAYQKIALGFSDAQDSLMTADRSDLVTDMLSMSTFGAHGATPEGAAKRACEIRDAVVGMTATIGLAYVDANEKAAIAAADCRAALMPDATTPLVKTIACARADLMREILGACASTAQRMPAGATVVAA